MPSLLGYKCIAVKLIFFLLLPAPCILRLGYYFRLYCEELLSTCLQFSSNQSVSNFLYDIATTSATLSADVLTAEDTHSAAILFCVSKVSESSVVQKFFIQLLEVRYVIISCLFSTPFLLAQL